MKEMEMFCMPREHRERLIERHKFYVDQSVSRIIRQFDDIENESLRFMGEEGGYVRLSRFLLLAIVMTILWTLKWRP